MKKNGAEKSSGVEQARQHLPAILDDAANGATTIITRRGREVAAVVPVADAKRHAPASLIRLAGTGRGLWGSDSAARVAELRDEWSR